MSVTYRVIKPMTFENTEIELSDTNGPYPSVSLTETPEEGLTTTSINQIKGESVFRLHPRTDKLTIDRINKEGYKTRSVSSSGVGSGYLTYNYETELGSQYTVPDNFKVLHKNGVAYVVWFKLNSYTIVFQNIYLNPHLIPLVENMFTVSQEIIDTYKSQFPELRQFLTEEYIETYRQIYLFNKNNSMFRHLPKEKQTLELVKHVVESDPYYFEFARNDLKNHPDVYGSVLKKHPELISLMDHPSEEAKISAIETDKKAYKYIRTSDRNIKLSNKMLADYGRQGFALIMSIPSKLHRN